MAGRVTIPHFDLPFRMAGAPTRTNLIPNGGSEVDITGFHDDGVQLSKSRSTEHALFGVASAKAVSGPSPPTVSPYVYWGPLVVSGVGQVFSSSVYVYALQATTFQWATGVYKDDDTTQTEEFDSVNYPVPANVWTRLTQTYTITKPLGTRLYPTIVSVGLGSAGGGTVYYDGAQTEVGPAVTSYIDTNGAPRTIQGAQAGAVVQQDSNLDVRNCVEAVIRTEVGSRLYVPSFGVEDPTFRTMPLDPAPLQQAIVSNEPRADILLSSVKDPITWIEDLIVEVSTNV